MANKVTLAPSVVRSVAKQIEYAENYEHMRTPDSVQFTQNGSEGEVRFRFELEGDPDGD